MGKLRRTREFVLSENVDFSERNFWDLWINRCSDDNSLLPFLKSKITKKRIWLFLIKNNKCIRVGLFSSSEDMVGRQYPFLTFSKFSIQNFELASIYHSLHMYYLCSSIFEDVINNGFMSLEYEKNFQSSFYNEKLESSKEKNSVIDSMANFIDEKYASSWLEVYSGKYISHNNSLTCSLYNKILGD